jgi:FkbM family methyltransferase
VTKINFNGTKIDFWKAVIFSGQKNIPISLILEQAYEQKSLIDENNKLLLKFINFLKTCKSQTFSQLLQDLFVSFIINKNFNNNFLEFGATDGKSLSNTYTLENELQWTGTLAEPDIQWFDSLKKNRPKANIITKCIWKKSGEKLNFFSSTHGVFSTIDSFRYSDKSSLPENSLVRNKNGKNFEVETISLNEVIKNEFNDVSPSYISVDTEGSEFEILNAFNFSKYHPVVFTVEHNFTELQNKIDKLMFQNGYLRVFRHLTAFDAWYISSKVMSKLI